MNVSPSVVTVVGLFSPVGTVTVFVPQTSTPLWYVAVWPSGRTVVEAGGEPPIVDVKVRVSVPEMVVIVVTLVVGPKPGAPIVDVKVRVSVPETVVMVVTSVVGPEPGAPMVDVKVRVWVPETVVMVVRPVAGPPGFPV